MNKYEGVFILKSDMEEKTRKKVFEKIVSTITEDGEVENVDEWGNRKLAYEINYIKEGYYYVVNFETKTDRVIEIERKLRINDAVIRYMIVKKDA